MCSFSSRLHAGSSDSSGGGADRRLLLPPLQVITPWDVSGGADGKVDYDKLIREVSHPA